MSDEYSKMVFEWYIKNRVACAFVGNKANELYPPPFHCNKSFQEFLKSTKFIGGKLRIGPFVLKSTPFTVYTTFEVKQYEYLDTVKATKGDVVVDVGAFVGDTSLYFSQLVGEVGKVYAFEPISSHYNVLVENIQSNGIKNVKTVKLGLFSESGTANMNVAAATSRISETLNGEEIRLVTLDEFANKNQLQKVDFIKMDIEGAELEALKGAEETLKKFKPKLAICVYHRGRDLIDIPPYLKLVVPEYKFF